jgi:molecular chaperone DnaJ
MAQRVPDLYAVLGVSHDASEDEIKQTYRRLARELHPDVNGDPGAEQRFKQITAAYDVLKDPAKRRQYDLFGTQGGQVGGDFFPFGDMGDLFDVFFGGSPFGGRRQTATRRRSRTQRGGDLFTTVTLGFEEAVFGTESDVVVDSLETCARCDGTGCEPGTQPQRCTRCGGSGQTQDVSRSIFGTVMTARPCTVCDGTGEEIPHPCDLCRGDGRVPKRETIQVQIPAGVEDGMELRVGGHGQDGRVGGAPGDLYVAIRVKPHPVFERRGQDLVCALSVPMTQAALGAELEIPTIDGDPEPVKLDPGVESGAILRLRGRGVPRLGGRGRGDLYITVQVETPKPKSKEERQLLERLAELRGEQAGGGESAGFAAKLRKLLEK